MNNQHKQLLVYNSDMP